MSIGLCFLALLLHFLSSGIYKGIKCVGVVVIGGGGVSMELPRVVSK
jgi:hypothetical protein